MATQLSNETNQQATPAAAQGSLVVVGGSERLDKQLRVLRRFAEMVRAVPGRRSIVILTSATGHPDILGGEYLRIFHELGWPAGETHMPPVATREQALHPRTVDMFRRAAGIYMTGGDQLTLMEIIGNTPTEEAIREAFMNGAIVGGTSAGASAIGNPMIARGGSGELKRGMITLSNGMGLIGHDIVVDTHFGQRGRFPRLLAAVAERPQSLGIGLDENTAIILGPNNRVLEIAGAGVAYFLDGSKADIKPVPVGTALNLSPLALDVLSAGHKYDLEARKAIE